MFYTKSDRMFSENAEGRDGTPVPLHNIDNPGEHSKELEEATSSGSSSNDNGTWGERDVGGPVNLHSAMLEYEELRTELTNVSRSRTSKSHRRSRSNARQQSNLTRILTSGSRRSRATTDLEAGEEKPDEQETDFELGEFLKDGHFEKRNADRSAKKVGVVYKNLTVKGVGATSTFAKTLPSSIMGVSPNSVCNCLAITRLFLLLKYYL